MKINEIKMTVEEVVGVEYIAEDGTVFHDKEECEKYEKSALIVVNSKLKRLNKRFTAWEDLLYASDGDCKLEIFDIKDEADLDNLCQYVVLTLSENRAYKDEIERLTQKINACGVGHEVMVFWGFEQDYAHVIGDGSLNAFVERLKENYEKILNPTEVSV